jgi:hypothetical protein
MTSESTVHSVVEAAAIIVHEAGENAFIPTIPTVLLDYLFKVKRLRSPVRFSFAMNINKSQRQLEKSLVLIQEIYVLRSYSSVLGFESRKRFYFS